MAALQFLNRGAHHRAVSKDGPQGCGPDEVTMFAGLHRRPEQAPLADGGAPRAASEPLAEAERATELPPGVPERGANGPSVGLALGGGAARGFAHIGVLRVLEKRGIRPNIIAGTSIGAVVGSIWAAGKLDMLEDWALSLTKRHVIGLLDFVLGGAGLIGGRRLMELMRRELGDLRIEELDTTFAAIATELGSGHEVWLTRGDLVEAVRASYALPGIFTPVKVGGRWLMDGALVNPIPVSAARAMGARMVIAVNLNGDAFGRGTVIHDHGGMLDQVGSAAEAAMETPRAGLVERFSPERLKRQFFAPPAADGPRGVSTVMVDAFNIIQDRIARSRLAGDPPDIALVPKLARVGLFDFHRAKETIAIGMEATERALDDIAATREALR